MQKLILLFCLLLLVNVRANADESPIVDIQTNHGTITVKLASDKAPTTVSNFLTYVNEGFYANTIFHRVIPGFMIQGGGFTTSFQQKPTHAPIILESANGLGNVRGAIAMARTDQPNSATAQFFINTVDNSNNFAPPGYAVFGSVIAGMTVVDSISKEPTRNDIPIKPVIIEAARVRQAQLSFSNLKSGYNVGETVQITLQEDTIQRRQALDLWVAVLLPNGKLLFISPENPNLFSLTLAPYKRAVDSGEINHVIAQLTIPPGLTGKYTLLAIFNATGSDVGNLTASLRSNLASAVVEIH